MSKKNNTGSRHPNWSLVFMIRDGAHVSKAGRNKIFKAAQDWLNADDDEQEVLVGTDHRTVATAERVLREMGLEALELVGKGTEPGKAWSSFWSFKRGVQKLSYLPHPRDEEQSEDTAEAA